jgi:DNA replication and repair protein RecF
MQDHILERNAGENRHSVFAWVRRVRLTNFRNFAHEDVELDAGLNVVHGENAQGKTNLLEALYLVSAGRLLRGSKDEEAIRWGTDEGSVEAELGHANTSVSVTLRKGTRKSAALNALKLPRASDLLGRFPSVCISSLDLALARGEPADRRLFLDTEISQVFPAYLKNLAAYKRALEHRNALLKRAIEGGVDTLEFEPWELQLAEAGAAIRTARSDFVTALSPLAAETHGQLADGEKLDVEVALKDPASNAEALLDRLQSMRHEEIMRGATTSGPHRDDLRISVQNVDARLFASQGQQRTAVISLKLATLRLGASRGVKPALLLDDILSDLDERRRGRLVEWIQEHAAQTVLTCTEPPRLPAAQAPNLCVRQGKLERP